MAARYPIRIITLSKLSAMKNNNLIGAIALNLTDCWLSRLIWSSAQTRRQNHKLPDPSKTNGAIV